MGKNSTLTMAALRTAAVLLNAPGYAAVSSFVAANACFREVINGGTPSISFTIDGVKDLGAFISDLSKNIADGDFETAAITVPFMLRYGMCIPGLIAGDAALAVRTALEYIHDGCYDGEFIDEEFAKINQLTNLDIDELVAFAAANSK